MNSSQSCPQYGPNILGAISTPNGKPVTARIEYIGPGGMLLCRTPDGKQTTAYQNNFSPMPTIPSKYREYHFQSLAPYWAAALTAYPKSVEIVPKGISQDTLVRKLREAREAKDKYGWQHPDIDDTLWKQNSHKIAVSFAENGKVSLGEPMSREITAFEAAVTSENIILVQWKNKANLEHFCKLASEKVFDPKPVFVVFGLDDATITDLENRYDVGFNPREDGKSHSVIF